MSVRPPHGAGGRRGGGGGGSKAAAVAGRSDVQERLRELRSRQDAWMRQRERSMGSEAASEEDAEPRKPPIQSQPAHPPQLKSSAASSTTSGAGAAAAATSGLLDRVRLELDDIEREVRASAGLPASAPSSAAMALASKTSAAQAKSSQMRLSASSGGGVSGSGVRPMSHYCPACGRLMLGADRTPQLLAPCGHSVCTACAPRPEEMSPSELRCPHCGLRISGARPDAALRAAVSAFTGGVTALPSAAATASVTAASAASAVRWLGQLEVISGRMRQLDASMEALQAEVAQLTGQLEAEAARDRQLAGSEAAMRKEIDRLQTELRHISEQRSVSRDNQAFIQSEIEAKKQEIQGAFTSQQLVSQELAKLQRLCAE